MSQIPEKSFPSPDPRSEDATIPAPPAASEIPIPQNTNIPKGNVHKDSGEDLLP